MSLVVCVEDTIGMKNELKPGYIAPLATVTVCVDAVIITSVDAAPVEPAVGIQIFLTNNILVAV